MASSEKRAVARRGPTPLGRGGSLERARASLERGRAVLSSSWPGDDEDLKPSREQRWDPAPEAALLESVDSEMQVADRLPESRIAFLDPSEALQIVEPQRGARVDAVVEPNEALQRRAIESDPLGLADHDEPALAGLIEGESVEPLGVILLHDRRSR